jgi:hypothetical protein
MVTLMVVTLIMSACSARRLAKETDSPLGQTWVRIDRVPAMLAEDNDVILPN